MVRNSMWAWIDQFGNLLVSPQGVTLVGLVLLFQESL